MQELIRAIRDRNALLFVGAGVSMNLGVPSWRQLTAHIAERLGHDPEEFARLGDDQTLAEYYLLETGSLGPLRSWMDVEWHRDAEKKVHHSAIHRLIVELGFPVIYTTNYDRYLELAHEAQGVKYVKVATIGEMPRAQAGVTLIVKLHGDFEDDGSIVLAESSHFDRLSLERPLDLKLRSDLLGRVALFIGYSVSDVSIRYILYQLHKQWQGSASTQARPKAYVFLGRPNLVQARVLASWGITPLFSETADIGDALCQLLEHLLHQVRQPERADDKPRSASRPVHARSNGAARNRSAKARKPSAKRRST